ncbi:hypothetical protein RHSIM_Rhsim11G0167000 [Rhododendron simsii]|uniref:Peptidase M16C associated domain-containing protein n=1 Tax=Rhododendron simsii TaxID=118357 RepID=A0A834G6J7_RHOSS|nr:hypothetical protein RHSIM_Rhsim11G0167000 [Rhododendron simsii]
MSTPMERAVVLRSLSCTPLVCTRFFSRSARNLLGRLSPLPKRHRAIANLHTRSLLRHHLRAISTSSTRPSIQLRKHFSTLSPRAIATPPTQPSPEVVGADDEVAKKLGFEKVSEEFIEECKSRAVLYKHTKTGAEIMSVSNNDENKVFGIVFRTPPKDSTGIPHILEHSVLCGSRKYPLKEPFVELLKGSLHTFLNAFTYPDRTCYPVASTNTKDFYNLVDVYLDAVFFPKCVEDFQTFQQEGWHYELNNPAEDITYKGVVFNEMKGVYSQPDNIMGRITQQASILLALFPDNTYGVDSGGDPQVIPNLSFEEFKEFHRNYYHPSNSRIWFYGDDDPTERLRILSEYLDMFDASSAPSESIIQPQKLFSKPVRIVEKYPAPEGGNLKKKHMVCLNWLLDEKPLDLETELALEFLDHLMLGTPASPLRKTLLESGLGDAIVGGGMDSDLLQPQFCLGLKGVSEDDIQKVEELIMNSLKNLAEEGFDSDAVEASMNTIEFALRENNTGSFPRGLALMLRSVGKWIYDRDPFEPLKYQKPLLDLKARIAKEGSKAVFAPLIEKYILNNSHLVTVEMQPDPEKASQDEATEREALKKVKASMTEEDLAELTRATHELRLKQETPDPPEALKAVPSLSLSDIPRKPIFVPTEVGDINGVKILQHDLFTNDVLYAEVVFNMSSLKQELLPLVPLFCQSLLEMGTKDMDFVQLNQLIGRKTGGISVSPLTSSIRGKEDPCSHIIVRGKAMSGRTEDLFNLRDRTRGARSAMDIWSIRNRWNHLCLGQTLWVVSQGCKKGRYTSLGARALLCGMQNGSRDRDDMEGVSSVQLFSCCLVFTFLIEVVLSLVGGGSEANQVSYSQGDGVSVSEEVNRILQDVQFTDQKRFKQFVSQSKARLEARIRGSGHGIAAARMDAKLNVAGWVGEQMGGASFLEFLKDLGKKVDEDWDGVSSSLEEIRRTLISRNGCLINLTADGKNLTNSVKFVSKFLDLLPSTSPVNYVGKAANIYDTGYELNGSAYVISKHISNTWLWDRVRVSGGAYGGFCDFDTHSGVFSFLSYRDPNLLTTLDVYDATGDFLRDLEMDNDTLTKAIIGTIGDVDSYQLPDAKGYSSLLRYLLGITEEERQKRREEILSTNLNDFKEFADAIDAVKNKGVVVAVASPEDVEAANKERSNFLEVKNVLD